MPGFASFIDLHSPAHYVHWHFFQISVANVVVIALMILVFVAAILLPFPGRSEGRSQWKPGMATIPGTATG
jgi:hypothetical protein